jgi:hypothetical protein
VADITKYIYKQVAIHRVESSAATIRLCISHAYVDEEKKGYDFGIESKGTQEIYIRSRSFVHTADPTRLETNRIIDNRSLKNTA